MMASALFAVAVDAADRDDRKTLRMLADMADEPAGEEGYGDPDADHVKAARDRVAAKMSQHSQDYRGV